jgi:hypothetical protein
MKLKILGVFVGLCFLAQPVTADPLSSVFDSYSQGSAGVYKTSRGTHFYAGNITTRIHQPNTPDLVGFSAPSVKAGCGGIDFYAGSFSLISGDEVVQMARGIAQGAAPYFFNLAISSICAGCGAAMQDLSNRLNELNQFAKASCQQFYKGLDEATGWSDAAAKNLAIQPIKYDEDRGLGKSWVDTVMNAIASKEPSAGAKESITGNLTYNLLTAMLGPTELTDTTFFSSKEGLKQTLMALIGTGIASYKPTSNGSSEEYVLDSIPSNIDPLRLILADTGTADPNYSFDRIDCSQDVTTDPKCVNVSIVKETMLPLEAQYMALLSGTDGIFRKLQRKQSFDTGTPTGAAQIEFMKSVDFPYVYLAINAEADGNIDTYSRYIAQRAAFARVESLYRIAIAVLYKAKLSKWGNSPEDKMPQVAAASIDARLNTLNYQLERVLAEDKKLAGAMVDQMAVLRANKVLSSVKAR